MFAPLRRRHDSQSAAGIATGAAGSHQAFFLRSLLGLNFLRQFEFPARVVRALEFGVGSSQQIMGFGAGGIQPDGFLVLRLCIAKSQSIVENTLAEPWFARRSSLPVLCTGLLWGWRMFIVRPWHASTTNPLSKGFANLEGGRVLACCRPVGAVRTVGSSISPMDSCGLRCAPFVPMMQPSDLRKRHHRSHGWRVNLSKKRSILAERQVGSSPQIIIEVAC